MIRRFLLLAAAAAPAPALAQAAMPAVTRAPVVIVTAPLEGEQASTLQGVSALVRADVLDRLAPSLGETVAHLPGVSSTFYGPGASRPIIRGLGDDRVRILQNGIGAIDAASASPDHAVTSEPASATRIEVLRGAAALAYGGNAIGGVVNVIDQAIPTTVPDRSLLGEAVVTGSSVDEGRAASLGLGASAGSLALRLELATRATQDYAIPGLLRSADARRADPLAPGVREIAGRAPNSFTDGTQWSIGAAWSGEAGFIGAAWRRLDFDYGLPPSAGETEGGSIDLKQSRFETRGEWKRQIGLFDRFDYSAQVVDYEHAELEEDGSVGTLFTNSGWEARLEAHHGGFAGRLEGAIGLQALDTDFAAEGEEAFITPTQTREVGLFTVQRYDANAWGLEAGARIERRDLDNDGGGSRDFTATSLSIGGFARPAPGWFAGLTLARTERAPTGVELFADGPHAATGAFERGDPDLGKETALSLEGALRRETARVRFELNLYHARFEDYVALLPTGLVWLEDDDVIVPVGAAPDDEKRLPVFDYRARDARFTGGEISIAAELARFGDWAVKGDAAFDWVRASFDGGGSLPRIPAASFTTGIELDSERWVLRAEAAYTADQDRVAAFETGTSSSTVVNLRAAWRPLGPQEGLRIVLEGRNVTDEEVREHASFLKDVLPKPGRDVRLIASIDF
jgi:iron complex outermembrane recepter protein